MGCKNSKVKDNVVEPEEKEKKHINVKRYLKEKRRANVKRCLKERNSRYGRTLHAPTTRSSGSGGYATMSSAYGGGSSGNNESSNSYSRSNVNSGCGFDPISTVASIAITAAIIDAFD